MTKQSKDPSRSPLPSSTEIERILETYRFYSRSGRSRRWDPTNTGNQCILRERVALESLLLKRVNAFPLNERSVLEIGCGTGTNLQRMVSYGAQSKRAVGVDLIEGRLSEARRLHPDLGFVLANAEQLPFPPHQFDLVLLYTVLTSILDPTMTKNVVNETARVLSPGGVVLWYDFRYDNPRNRQVRGINLSEIHNLFQGWSITAETATVLPPLVRRLGAAARWVYPVLRRVPYLRTHLAAALIKPASGLPA